LSEKALFKSKMNYYSVQPVFPGVWLG